MKVLVIHDKDGNIRSMGVVATSLTGQVKLQAREGLHVSEVEVPDLRSEQDHEQLERLKAEYRIELGSDPKQLVHR